MELTGVALDVAALEALSNRLRERIRELETEIYALAGEEFNISSPQQLQRILFDKLKLAPDRRKRTKTGFSTNAEVLAGLSEHEIVAHLLEYRELTKLKGTYIDALPKLVEPPHGAGAHLLQPGGDGDRAAEQQRPEPAEHPHPPGAGGGDPARLHRRRRGTCCSRRTTRRSSCASWPTSRATSS